MKAKFTVDKSSFDKMVTDVKRESRRSTDDMLRYVATLMLKTAAAETPLGRKNRVLETESGSSKDARFFRIHKQGAAPEKIFVPSIPRKKKNNESERAAAMAARDAIVAKFKAIKYRGVAKASWHWAISKIQGSKSLSGLAQNLLGMMRRDPISVEKQITDRVSSLEVTNELGWIRKITPDIEEKMRSSAFVQMGEWLRRRWDSGIRSAQQKTKG